MPNDKIRNPGGPSLATRLNHQSRNHTAGYSKTNEDEVRVFKQKIKDGVGVHAAREGTKISERMGKEIIAGRTWASVVVMIFMAMCLMGNSCEQGGKSNNDRRSCWSYDYPLCSEVPSTYPCLCLHSRASVTSVSDELELFNATPTPDYEYEGGDGES